MMLRTRNVVFKGRGERGEGRTYGWMDARGRTTTLVRGKNKERRERVGEIQVVNVRLYLVTRRNEKGERAKEQLREREKRHAGKSISPSPPVRPLRGDEERGGSIQFPRVSFPLGLWDDGEVDGSENEWIFRSHVGDPSGWLFGENETMA